MSTTLLRKLTEKSTLKFGKYYDLKVIELINLKKTALLRWYYYNASMITFTDEVLDKILVPKEYRIIKPGKKPEYHTIVNEILIKNMSGLLKYRLKKGYKKYLKSMNVSLFILNKSVFSKNSLRLANHGHLILKK